MPYMLQKSNKSPKNAIFPARALRARIIFFTVHYPPKYTTFSF